jgi:hypothetical protein
LHAFFGCVLDTENFQNNVNFSGNSQNFISFWLKFQKKMGEIILQKRLISQKISMKMTRFSKTLVLILELRGLFSVLFFWKSRMIYRARSSFPNTLKLH